MSKAKVPSYSDLAFEKLTKVFGAEKARILMASMLTEIQLPDLLTADDLFLFSRALEKRGAFEAAVGVMLGIQAIIRGASGDIDQKVR